MADPADTIREALNYPKRPHKGMTLQALAALTELEDDRDRLQGDAAEYTLMMETLVVGLREEAQTLRDALEDLAALERPADLMRQIARAALATPDTPPDNGWWGSDFKEAAPDTPPDS